MLLVNPFLKVIYRHYSRTFEVWQVFFLECSPPALSAPKRLFFRFARNGKQGRCAHTCYFCVARGPAKMLVGEFPKPAVLRDKLSQSPGALHRSLRPVTIVPGPYFHARLLCRADDQCSLLLPRLPHLPLGLPVFCIKRFSFVPPAHGGIFFSASILGSFAPFSMVFIVSFAAR